MPYTTTDLLNDIFRAVGGLPSKLDPEIDDVAGAHCEHWQNEAKEWFAESPSELLEELLKADWHQHKAMHVRLEQLVAEEFAKDGEFRRLALAAIRPALEAKAEELADAMLKAREANNG